MATIETPKTNLEPVRENLYATIHSIDRLMPSDSKHLTVTEVKLRALIESSSFGFIGYPIGAELLQASSVLVNSDDLGQPLRNRFKRFNEDISHIIKLESDGITGINNEISRLINPLLPTSIAGYSFNESKARMRTLNDILLRAIYLYPHLAKGVEIQLPIEKRLANFGEVYPDQKSGRKRFDKLSQIWQVTRGQDLQTLTLPLPYLEDSDYKITKEYELGNYDDNQANACFAFLLDNQHCWTIPGLAIQIGPDNEERTEPLTAYFAMEEIGGIKLVSGEDEDIDFTPELKWDGLAWNLEPRPNWIRHYLDFRRFGPAVYRVDNDFMADKAELHYQSLLVPEDNSELIKMRKSNWWSLNVDSIEQAFIALDLYPHMVMYEVRGAFPWDKSIRQNAPYLLDRILSDSPSHERGKVQRYVGEDIISRLAAIPKGL